MIQLGIVPSWQFDPNNPYNRNPHLVMPEGMTQTTVQPVGPTTFGVAGLGITMVSNMPHPVTSLGGLDPFPATWGWAPKIGVVAILGTGIWYAVRHFGKKRRRR